MKVGSLNCKQLLIRPEHQGTESLRAYAMRVSWRNGGSPLLKPRLVSLKATTAAINYIADLTGCSADRLRAHGAYKAQDASGNAGMIFGGGYVSQEQVFLSRRYVCPACLSEENCFSDCCWELRGYNVCHRHGFYLAGRCLSCDRTLSWYATSPEACSCGAPLTSLPKHPASESRRLLCTLIANAMSETLAQSNEPNSIEDPTAVVTPLQWVLLLLNFTRSLLIPHLLRKYLGFTGEVKEPLLDELQVQMLSEREYFQHLCDVIYLHTARQPIAAPLARSSEKSRQDRTRLLRRGLKDIRPHISLAGIKLVERNYEKITRTAASNLVSLTDEVHQYCNTPLAKADGDPQEIPENFPGE